MNPWLIAAIWIVGLPLAWAAAVEISKLVLGDPPEEEGELAQVLPLIRRGDDA
jgi:hypothetical protein